MYFMKIQAALAAALLLMAGRAACQGTDPPMTTKHKQNHLAGEKSPYLLQHADNPVDWYPWGEEAFEKARQENKPIFLSVGYSTCHWCHVMAHESFEDPKIAALLNEHFVSVKVDREERPDVDRVYMTFVQATTGSGGWPMSVWLTPELKPFVGGTYFPPTDRYGRPGFASILRHIAELWEKDREKVIAQGDQMIEALREHTEITNKSGAELGVKQLDAAYQQITSMFDEELGGFGSAPKFPRPVTLEFLFQSYARLGAGSPEGKHALEMALKTLRAMAAGGMHDQLGGGFHRYSVDKFWHVPHFEKMLYDQAQLAQSYLDAYQITREPIDERVARDTLDYVLRDMTAPSGGFYSAEDADSLLEHGKKEHAEGAFYVWTNDEIEQLLGNEAEAFESFFGVEKKGNAPAGSDPQGEFTGKNILIQRQPDEAQWKALAGSREKLLEARAKRPRPHLDDKIITAWNGMMISAFARGYAVLGDARYLAAAQRAAAFLREKLYADGKLIRSYREGASDVGAFADDYAALIAGLIDLYEADFDIAHLQWAVELQKKQNELFLDREHGGYFSATGGDKSILLRMKEDYDGAEPSPNSVSAQNLLRLAQMTGDEAWTRFARETMSAFATQLTQQPTALPCMLAALDFSLHKPKQIVLAGKLKTDGMQAMLREVRSHFLPNKIVLLADGAAGQEWLAERLEFLKTVSPINGEATAFVCEDFVCQLPTTKLDQLRTLLAPQR